MNVNIRGNHSLMLQIVREHVEKRLRFALGRFGPEILRTRCEIDDVNGPRGGNDKSCRIAVELKSGETVRAEATDADFFTSVDRAAERAERGVARFIARRRDRSRQPAELKPLEGTL